jgi:hypothetical protein
VHVLDVKNEIVLLKRRGSSELGRIRLDRRDKRRRATYKRHCMNVPELPIYAHALAKRENVICSSAKKYMQPMGCWWCRKKDIKLGFAGGPIKI